MNYKFYSKAEYARKLTKVMAPTAVLYLRKKNYNNMRHKILSIKTAKDFAADNIQKASVENKTLQHANKRTRNAPNNRPQTSTQEFRETK